MITVYSYSDPVRLSTLSEDRTIGQSPVAFLDGTYGIRQYTDRFNAATDQPEILESALTKFDVISGAVDLELPMSILGSTMNLPMVQMLDGRYLEQGHVYTDETDREHSFLQFRSADGAAVGHRIELQGTGILGSGVEDIQFFGNGGFVATWNQYDLAHASAGWNIASQIFNKFGKPVSGVLTIAAVGDQSPPEIAVLTPSRFVEVWVDTNAGWSLKAQVFDLAGAAVTTTITLCTDADNQANAFDVVTLTNGNFAVTWTEELSNDDWRETSFNAQVFSASGAPVSSVITFASMAVDHLHFGGLVGSSLIALTDGRFAVAWTESVQAPEDAERPSLYSSYLLQVYDADGHVASPLYGLGPNDGLEVGLGIVALADGRIAATWNQWNLVTRADELTTQILDPRDHGIDLTGNALADQYAGSAFADAIRGLAGDDTLFGNAGNDVLIGGTGNDLLLGGIGYDKLIGNDGSDYLSGFDGNDRLVGGKGADLVVGGKGSDVFVFAPGDGADRIKGFTNGVDRIDLSAYGFDHGWMALRHFAEVAGGIQFTAGQDTILITGLAFADLGGSDLIL